MLSYTNATVVYSPLPTSRPSASKNPSKPCLAFLIVVIALLLGTTIMLAILYSMERYNTNDNQTKIEISTNNGDVCLTRQCIKAAHHLLENIDETVDPCENFYRFTCGSWMKNTKLTNNNPRQSPTGKISTQLNEALADLLSSSPPNRTMEPKAITNARRLYKSCVDELSIELESWVVMHRLIDGELGGLPSIANSQWNESNFDLSNTLLKFNQYNYFPFYQVTTTIDYKSPDRLRYRIRISPGNRRSDRDSSLVDENLSAKPYKYLAHDLSLISTNQEPMANTEDTGLGDFAEEIEKHLSILTVPYSTTDVVTTIGNLSKAIKTNFDFGDYIRRLYLLGNVTLTDEDIVVIGDIESIREIATIIARQSSSTLQSYMIVHFIQSHTFHMPKRIRRIFEARKTTTFDVPDEESRSIACAKYVNKNMPFAVSKLYIDKYYDKSARQQSFEMVDNIRNTFIHMVNKSTWMDVVSKKNTIEKAQAVLEKVGYPDYLEDENMAKLENIYAKHSFNSVHIQNVLLLLQLNAKENLKLLHQPVNRKEWTTGSPTAINAFYRPLFNDIIIPAGILRPPFFHKDTPQYLNYGAIGSVVGHEITHGFDELRRHIDKDAKEYKLWSNQTNDMYERRSKCIIEQYNNYTISQISEQVDGNRTRDENIADNDGLKKAFYAYRNWVERRKVDEKKLPGLVNYSAEQMFFISFGQIWCSKVTDTFAMILHLVDDHSPAEFRVNGATSNFVEFDRVFGCKPGQKTVV